MQYPALCIEIKGIAYARFPVSEQHTLLFCGEFADFAAERQGSEVFARIQRIRL